MTDKELQKVLDGIKYIPSEDERDEVTQIILRAASESIALERLKSLMAKKDKKTDSNENGASGFITFTKKECKAFTKAEEKEIIDFCYKNPNYAGNSALLVLLYTGMRVGEIKSMNYDGTYITCVSEKTRKGYAEVVRKIPISPMMKKVLPLIDFEQAKSVSRYTIRDALKRIFPDRHIHELRYSFITRAKECSVLPEVVMKWVGHEYDADCKSSKVDRGYTDFSEEFLLKEINKIDYEL